ncbi:C40 family peptidase, partial [Patescibacteria group bacterium]|nr:C40 family peptidase [Patescibacteria group bacterium]
MKISYQWLQLYFKKKLPKPEKVAEVLTMHSFEVESVERKGKDFVFNIDVLPNRAHDCLSHIGIAKELSALSNYKLPARNASHNDAGGQIQKTKQIPNSKISKKLQIEIKEPQLCKRYVGRIIEGVKVKESPKWLKEKLETIGQKTINNIVDAANFVMFETGQPLHAFDADKVEGKIIVRKAKKGEKITTLDNQEIELNENILIIADEKSPLAIAGIKGGKKAEITKDTKNIILEAANFEPDNIRKTVQRINLSTESSLRFGAGITPELTDKAMNRLTEIILGTAKGPSTSSGQVVDIYPKKVNPYVLGIHPRDVAKNLGVEIPEKEIINILQRLGFGIKKIKPINNILKLAKSLIGKPYKYGASVSFDAPDYFDCSSFISYVFSQSGVQIPRVSIDQFLFGKEINEKDLKPGDIIFSKGKKPHFNKIITNGVGHVGIYLGENKVIHASGAKVAIEDYRKASSFKELRGFRRMISENNDLLVLTVPIERLDIRIKEDLIEEVARIYGYEKIPSQLPKETLIPPMLNDNYECGELIRNILIGSGFSEVYNYSFSEKGDRELVNPIAREKKFLRTNLLDGLNKNMMDNLRYFKSVKIFEIGKIFLKNKEKISLAGISSSATMPTGRQAFYEIKGVVENLLSGLAITDFWLEDSAEKVADIKIGNDLIGHIDHNGFEIDFEKLAAKAEEELEYMPISRYPAAQRDISLFVPLR